jgi:hypothetical protein
MNKQQIMKEAGFPVSNDQLARDFGLLNQPNYQEFLSLLEDEADTVKEKEAVESMRRCLTKTSPRKDYGNDYERLRPDQQAQIRQEAKNNPTLYALEWSDEGSCMHNFNNQYVEFTHRCKHRSCPVCAKIRAKNQKRALMKYFQYKKKSVVKKYINDKVYTRFLTLTYHAVNGRKALRSVAKQQSKDFSKFTRTLERFGFSINSGIKALEANEHKNIEKQFNPHIHAVSIFDESKPTKKQKESFCRFIKAYNKKYSQEEINPCVTFSDGTKPTGLGADDDFSDYDKAFKAFGRYNGFIDKNILSCIWRNSNHSDSYVVDIQVLKHGIGGGISYICKYLSKGTFHVDANPKTNIDFFFAFRNIRLLQRFGKMKGYNEAELLAKLLFFIADKHGLFPFSQQGKEGVRVDLTETYSVDKFSLANES